MAEHQQLQVQKKREHETRNEATIPARVFVPAADIYETPEALSVILEMPGVEKSNVDIQVKDDVVRVEGRPTYPSTKDCSRSISNTTSATTPGHSSSPTRSIRTRSLPK
jgi:HSP20 family protein